MKIRLYPIAVALLLGLAACVTEYSKSEAPTALQVDGAQSRVEIAFAGGSDRLSPGEARRLDGLVLAGNIRPADRVAIAAAGPPGLAERRAAAISGELLRYGIVASTRTLDALPANRAIVSVGRYTVTLPSCPNWSQSLSYEFTNAFSSNYGCANTTNLGLMVASPADLVSGRTPAPADGQPAVAAVERYMNDRVKQPPTPTASPFAASTGGGGESGGGAAAGGAGAGAGTGAQ
ncbi:MAG TPA: CpaD family pilus assembly lipoprotein [Stellaceae bacterium]|jgi:pilus assembly protein CpaD|nr:CpaD family pilus assembly lipoprotein [Stellaceae bacterium]